MANPQIIVHTMSELHFPGNCLRGSRPILSFSHHFSTAPHLTLIRELLTHIFSVPKNSRKTKPFVDHVLGFTIADNKIWTRCFQISETATSKSDPSPTPNPSSSPTNLSLIEIGPRFVLTPIVILESSFGGPVIYENKEFVSPNRVRGELRRGKAGRYNARAEQGLEREGRKGGLGLRTEGERRERDELSDGVVFGWEVRVG